MFNYPSFMLGVYVALLIQCIVHLIQMIVANKQYKKRMKEIDDKYNKKDV